MRSPADTLELTTLLQPARPCGAPASLERFVAALSPARRRHDVSTLLEVYARATQSPPHLSRRTVGYGALRRAGDGALPEYAARFSLRRSAICIHLADGARAHMTELRRLGAHTVSVGCIRITSLSHVDLGVLERIIRTSYIASMHHARAGQAALSAAVTITTEEQNASERKEVVADDPHSLRPLIPDGWRVRAIRTS